MKQDAIIAALIHLASSMEDGEVVKDDGDIGAILTCDGTHEGLDAGDLRDLAAGILDSSISLTVTKVFSAGPTI